MQKRGFQWDGDTWIFNEEENNLSFEIQKEVFENYKEDEIKKGPEHLFSRLCFWEMKANSIQEELIKLLRSLPYQQYLQTEHWEGTSEIAKWRARYKCQVCSNQESLNTHHRTYKNKGNEKKEDLIVLCNSCHKTFHENGKLAGGGRG